MIWYEENTGVVSYFAGYVIANVIIFGKGRLFQFSDTFGYVHK